MKKISRLIKTESQYDQLVTEGYNLLSDGHWLHVEISDGKSRTNAQNRLQRQWGNDLESQGDMKAEEYRAHNKLHFGVPILRANNEKFRLQYDEVVKPLPYEAKLKLMMEPIDFPVTRLMSVSDFKQYLDQVYVFWTGEDFHLTDPSTQGMAV